MAVLDVRSYRRVPNQSVVDLVRTDGTRIKETALTQNVSAVGMRLTTEKIWRPGDCVLLRPHEKRIPAQMRVVYCHRLENGRFAVGLQLMDELEGPKNLH